MWIFSERLNVYMYTFSTWSYIIIMSCEQSVLVFCSSVGMAKSHDRDVQSLVFDHWQQICWVFVRCKSKDAVGQGKFKEKLCLLFKRGTDFVHGILAIGNSSILFNLICELIGLVNLYLHCAKNVTVNLSLSWFSHFSKILQNAHIHLLFWPVDQKTQ